MPTPCSTQPCSSSLLSSSARQNHCSNRCPKTAPNMLRPTACVSSWLTSIPSPRTRFRPPHSSANSSAAHPSNTNTTIIKNNGDGTNTVPIIIVVPSMLILSSTYCCPVGIQLFSCFCSLVIRYNTGQQPDNKRTTTGQELDKNRRNLIEGS